jgi:hypothetical protein
MTVRHTTPRDEWQRFRRSLPPDANDEPLRHAYKWGGLGFLMYVTRRGSPTLTRAVSDELIEAARLWDGALSESNHHDKPPQRAPRRTR